MVKTSSKIIKTIPNSEVGKTICFTKSNSSGEEYLITHNPLKQQFTLWKIIDGGYERIKVDNSPNDFDDFIPYEHLNE